jgi:hypothetical protein
MLKDPTGQKSSTQTLLIISFILMVAGAVCEMLGYVKSTSILPELFYSCCAMYTGRRFKFGDKEIGSK